MAKKLLLNLINGVLLVSFCNMGKAVGAVSSLHLKERDFPVGKKKVMKKRHKSKKSSLNRSVEPVQKAELPPPSPPPQEFSKPEGIQVICNARVLEVYRSCERVTGLWKSMLDLTEEIAEKRNWSDSKGARNLVYHLAKMYVKSDNQNTKDAIALYFVDTAERYAGELAGGDDEGAEQDAIDFVNECLVDEE